jgi:hypothetical protein
MKLKVGPDDNERNVAEHYRRSGGVPQANRGLRPHDIVSGYGLRFRLIERGELTDQPGTWLAVTIIEPSSLRLVYLADEFVHEILTLESEEL